MEIQSISRVFIVDDHSEKSQFLNGVLTKGGYQVDVCEPGKDAHLQIVQQQPDLVLIEIGPKINTEFELLKKIKVDPSTNNIFVILISNLGTSIDNQERGFELGADGYLLRPISDGALLAQINKFILQKNLIDQQQGNERKYRLETSNERKIADLALKKTNESHSQAEYLAKLGYFERNWQTGEGYWSRGFYRLLGLDPDDTALSHYEFSEFLHPDDKQRVLLHIKDALTSKLPMDIEFRLTQKNYRVLHIHGIAKNLYDVQGNPLLTQGTFQDITDDKNAEKALAASEHKFRSLFENINVAVALHKIITDDQGNPIDFTFLEINPFYEKITGLKRELAVGKKGLDVIPNLEKKWIEIYGKVALSGEPVSFIDHSDYLDRYWDVKAYAPEPGYFAVAFTDATERIKGQQSLKESEERYKSFISHSSEGIYRIDIVPPVPVDLPAEKIIKHLNKHAVVAEVNDALSKMYGLSSEEMIGKPATDFAPDYGKRAELVLREKNYHISGVETLDIDKYGKPLYLEESYHGEVHEGYLYRIWGVQRNITERKQAEEVIRISENKFRSLAETSVDCIWQSDLRLRFTYLSPALYPMTGFHPEEWIGTPLSKHVRITEFIKMARLALKVIKSYKTFDFVVIENHFLRKNGEEFPVEIIGKPLIESGKLIGLQGTARDITERKQAEKSLKERELRYYTLLQNLGGMVYRCKNDKDWTMLFVSEGCLGLTGYKPEDLLNNKMLSFNNLVDADVRDFLWDTWQAKLNRREPVEMEYRIKKATGEWIWVWERGRGIFDDDGQLMHLEGYIFDVTDRRKAEDELVSARDRAEESDRLKSAFLANMSHEIRTPMNGILGFADLLKEPDLTGEEQQKYIRVIENSGQRMLNTINDLIDISKIESGQMEVVMADTGINEQMETLFSFFKPEANKKELQLSYKNGLPDTNAIIHTDSEKLFAILTNLVKNAIKYTNKGSIEFAYTLKQTNNTLPGNPDKAGEPVEPVELEFYVKDTGIGIPPEKFDMIFERFAQADNYLTKSYEGSGLGLSISKAYVEMLGGRIWVESGQGKGTAFYFSLPYNPIASQKDVQTIVTDKVVDFSLPKRIKVLVVEDDADSREFLSEILARISADVIFVSNGLDAIDQCKSNPNLDIILMDIKMPGMDGYEATQRIRKFNKEVVIIAQTAFAFAGDRVKALHAGCNDYISKPIGKEKLLKLIHHLIT